MRKLLLAGMYCAVLGAASALDTGAIAATLTVTNANDSGPGSLREAIALAADRDQIIFDESISGASIRFTSAEVVINKNLELIGRGPDLTIIAGPGTYSYLGNPPHRVFSIAPGISVAIANLTLEDGNAASDFGGAIFNQGTLRLVDCVVEQNEAQKGAGIYNADGHLELVRTTLRGHCLDNDLGTLFNNSSGNVTIEQCTFEQNSVSRAGGTGFYNTGAATIVDSVFRNNSASGASSWGGAIANYGSLLIGRSAITANGAYGEGGGIYNNGILEIWESLIENNFSNNAAGAIQNNGNMVLINTTIYRNRTHMGLGAVGNRGSLVIISSTISGNTNDYYYSGAGAGVFNLEPASGVVVRNSLIVGNLKILDCPTPDSACFGDCAGTITSLGNNIVGAAGNDCQGFVAGNHGDRVGLALEQILESTLKQDYLGTGVSYSEAVLGDNGGPTPTLALLPDSPGIDSVPRSECLDGAGNPLTIDQRGVPRPQGAACDIGAFEFSAPRDTLFWMQQCREKKSAVYSEVELDSLFSAINDKSSAFPECALASCASLEPDSSQSSWKSKASRELLAVWLNLASGRLTKGRPVDLHGLSSATFVGAAVAEVEATVCNTGATRQDLSHAKDIAVALNESADHN